MTKSLSLLFVCVGNTCRSAMAEGLAKRRWPNFEIESAGIRILPDQREAAPEAIGALKGLQIDISGHKTTSIDEVDVTKYDFVIAMDPAVVPVIRSRIADRDKLYKCFIDDPYGDDDRAYDDCADMISLRLDEFRLHLQL